MEKFNKVLIGFIAIFVFAACESEPIPHNPHAADAPVVKAAEPAAATTPSAPAAAEIKPPAAATAATTAPAVMPAAPAHKRNSGVEAEKALGWLKNGNTRFASGHVRKDGQSQKDIQRLASNQQPHAIVLSCSDSRVPPELVFDQKLGEIFVVRTAGETLDPTSIASIEYAVEHLGSNLIVVMGHTSCGAVKAAFSTLDGSDAGSANLNKLVGDIHPRIQQFSSKQPSEGYEKEVWANSKGVAHDLLTRSDILRRRVDSGEIKIVTAVYHLNNGKVEFQ